MLTAVDPAKASLDVARAKPGADAGHVDPGRRDDASAAAASTLRS